MSSLGKLIKQAARVQAEVEKVQAQLAQRTVQASSGGGAVTAVARCDGTLVSIKIDPAAVNPAEVQLLEDLVLAAVNQALRQARDISTAEMSKATAGFQLPGMR
jgi:DNA-binding YbaB/EbfC family protein